MDTMGCDPCKICSWQKSQLEPRARELPAAAEEDGILVISKRVHTLNSNFSCHQQIGRIIVVTDCSSVCAREPFWHVARFYPKQMQAAFLEPLIRKRGNNHPIKARRDTMK